MPYKASRGGMPYKASGGGTPYNETSDWRLLKLWLLSLGRQRLVVPIKATRSHTIWGLLLLGLGHFLSGKECRPTFLGCVHHEALARIWTGGRYNQSQVHPEGCSWQDSMENRAKHGVADIEAAADTMSCASRAKAARHRDRMCESAESSVSHALHALRSGTI